MNLKLQVLILQKLRFLCTKNKHYFTAYTHLLNSSPGFTYKCQIPSPHAQMRTASTTSPIFFNPSLLHTKGTTKLWGKTRH